MDNTAKENIISAYNMGYRINEDGCAINKNGKVLAARKAGHGYYAIGIRLNGKVCNIPYHRLMAYQKFGDLIFGSDCIRHLNGNCLDNSYDNIELGTASDNMMDIPKHVRMASAIKATPIKYNNVQEIRDYYNACHSLISTMKHFGISSKGTLHYILHKRTIFNK